MRHAEFVHLHNHSHYSLLDGAVRVEKMVEAARGARMPALALTDHGNLFGAVEFYMKATAMGVKPIVGCEVYVARESRHKRREEGRHSERSHHLPLVKPLTSLPDGVYIFRSASSALPVRAKANTVSFDRTGLG